MMIELSLNVLDIAQNSIRAGATLIEISVLVNFNLDTLTIIIKDNGCGMDREQLARITDPFYTTRTTRRIGLGIPFFKYAAESTGGSFTVESEKGKGTIVTSRFTLSHIDRMPLGDMTATMHTLITLNHHLDFVYTYAVDQKHFILDTREFRQILGDVPFTKPEISTYIREYLAENRKEVDNGKIL